MLKSTKVLISNIVQQIDVENKEAKTHASKVQHAIQEHDNMMNKRRKSMKLIRNK